MRCERHELAAGPDGRCALCARDARAFSLAVNRGRDPARKIAIWIVALMAALAAFALAGALLDTR